jgi:hypothetical protein
MNIAPATVDMVYLVAADMRDEDFREISATRNTIDKEELARQMALNCSKRGEKLYAVGDETPIAIVGVLPLWPGVWSATMFATDELDKIGKELTKFAYKVIMPSVFRANPNRIECRSIDGHTKAQKWIEFMGLKYENTNRNFGKNGEDFHTYAWVAGDPVWGV